MPSPFPGMNPYLESPRVWKDFHDRFLVYAAEALGPQAAPRYLVRITEHVFVHDEGADGGRRGFHADLAVTPPPGGAGGPTTLVAPATVTVPAGYRRRRVGYLEVRDRDDGHVVSVIELLSPSNKKGDREQFEAKRQALLGGNASYVEVDLLRGGRRLEWGGMPACHYYAAVSRPDDRPRTDFWPIRLRDSLPPIPIPLGPNDPEPRLDLQAVLHRTYDAAGYHRYIYHAPPEPPLSPDDAAWAEALIPPPPTGPG